MLWRQYVLRRGREVHDTWDALFDGRTVRLLYIAGRGFDIRARAVMNALVENLRDSARTVEKAELLLIGFTGYMLDEELRDQTEKNAAALEEKFRAIGTTQSLSISSSAAGEDDISASTALRAGAEEVLQHVQNQTDIILDVSSLPRTVYLALLTGLLHRLVPDKKAPNALASNGVNLQVLVGEDASLDAEIRSEDPGNDLILIPGFSSALHAESLQDWPLVWFPMLGENKVSHLQKVMSSIIPMNAEICPILPHPSRDPRRADRLLVEYRQPLFDVRETPTTNILYAHESNPFEVYRQLITAMLRYRDSMRIVGGCRLVVTPLASKLITLGAGLACFEMRPIDLSENYGIAIPNAQPTRYLCSVDSLRSSQPEISTLVLTGDAYDES